MAIRWGREERPTRMQEAQMQNEQTDELLPTVEEREELEAIEPPSANESSNEEVEREPEEGDVID